MLKTGVQADICIVEPRGLDEALDATFEEPIAAYGEIKRMVRRTPRAVPYVLINGHIAVEDGLPTTILGQKNLGSVLRARQI